jgi:hypothetical protein
MHYPVDNCLDCPLRGTRFSKGEQWDECQHPYGEKSEVLVDPPATCPLRNNELVVTFGVGRP